MNHCLNPTEKDFNKQELEINNKSTKNKLDKIHEQYELGLKIALKAKNKLVHKLEQQLQKATSSMTQKIIDEQIEKIKQWSHAKFLKSEFGKPIKDILEKQGLSESALKSYKDELSYERAEIRKKKEKNLVLNKMND